MPPWKKPLDVDRLADGGVDVEFDIPIEELPGLRSARGGVAGKVRGRVRFTREQGTAVAELSLSGSATLECQRCLRPMELPLEVVTRIALVSSAAQSNRVPPDLEPVLAAEGRISIGELVTEELLLSLPIVALHPPGTRCAGVPADPATPEQGAPTHKPFARLAELLKR